MAGTGSAHLRETEGVLLSVKDLQVTYRAGGGARVQAVSEISFDISQGETLGIVGESGCGKSTTGRAVLRLVPVDDGEITFDGDDLLRMSRRELRSIRQKIQLVFQDPISSLNPRMNVRDIVTEGLRVAGCDRDEINERAGRAMNDVGLDLTSDGDRRPREFSGGQCQRIGIARALAVEPRLLVCDEPVSALDVSVQAQILNLLMDMQQERGLAMMFIAHDLSVIEQVADRVLVLYMGKSCEVGLPADIYERPAHPYTQLLLASIPIPDPSVRRPPPTDDGETPSPMDPPSGCRFRTRCPRADSVCATCEPVLRQVGDEHFVACHHPTLEVV